MGPLHSLQTYFPKSGFNIVFPFMLLLGRSK
jgi:hypothetical protein